MKQYTNSTALIRRTSRRRLNRKNVKRLKRYEIYPHSTGVDCKMPLSVYSNVSIRLAKELDWDIPF